MVKLPARGGASRAPNGAQDASKGNFIPIVPLNPAYKAELAGHVPVGLFSIKRMTEERVKRRILWE